MKHTRIQRIMRLAGGTLIWILSLSATAADLSASDTAFLNQAAIGNIDELQASRLAVSQAADPRLKHLAAYLVTDHEKMSAALQKLAAQKQIKLQGGDDAQRSGRIEELGEKQGAAFDKAYLEQMIMDHETTLASFEHTADATKDPAVKAFIAEQLPTLRRHAEAASTMYSTLRTTP